MGFVAHGPSWPCHAVGAVEVGPELARAVVVHDHAARGAVDHVVFAEQIARVLVGV